MMKYKDLTLDEYVKKIEDFKDATRGFLKMLSKMEKNPTVKSAQRIETSYDKIKLGSYYHSIKRVLKKKENIEGLRPCEIYDKADMNLGRRQFRYVIKKLLALDLLREITRSISDPYKRIALYEEDIEENL